MNIVRSFHINMSAQIRLDGKLLGNQDILWTKTIPPTLLNLYSCAVTEKWYSRVRHVEGIGTTVCMQTEPTVVFLQIHRRSWEN